MQPPDRTRKTYLMLDKTNALKFEIDPNTGRIVSTYPETRTFYTKTVRNDRGIAVTTTTAHNTVCWTFRFPEEFINSRQPKSIEVHQVKIIYTDNNRHAKETKDIILHSDIIKRDAYLDHSVMVCNEIRTKYKKYAWNSVDKTFQIWFTSFSDPTKEFNEDELDFMIEMMLIY